MFSPQKREERRDAIKEKKMAKKREGNKREGPLKRKEKKQTNDKANKHLQLGFLNIKILRFQQLIKSYQISIS